MIYLILVLIALNIYTIFLLKNKNTQKSGFSFSKKENHNAKATRDVEKFNRELNNMLNYTGDNQE